MALLEARSGSRVSGLLRSLVSTGHEKVAVEQQYRMCRVVGECEVGVEKYLSTC